MPICQTISPEKLFEEQCLLHSDIKRREYLKLKINRAISHNGQKCLLLYLKSQTVLGSAYAGHMLLSILIFMMISYQILHPELSPWIE